MSNINAGIVGVITIVSYIANYFLRNMLGVLTPFILKTTNYTKEYLALLSSLYMVSYAVGQLFNGVLGDFTKPKNMVLIGLIAAGAVSLAFPFMPYAVLRAFCFIVLGYGLSMVRGPLMKIISENMKPGQARLTCVFFSFASFAGPLVASLISMIFNWRAAFVAAGVLTIVTAISAFVALTILEKRELISFKQMKHFGIAEMFGVFKIEGFAVYVIIACLVEIAATSISFWIPTFLNEYLLFDEKKANMVFSGISLVRAAVPFVTLWLYGICGENDVLIMKAAYTISVIAFAAAFIVTPGIQTVVLLLVALAMNSMVSALLWSIYIPSLGKTGRVSGINGILDCSGYVAASAATSLFAWVVAKFSWRGLIVAWGIIPMLGLVTAYISGKRIKQKCK